MASQTFIIDHQSAIEQATHSLRELRNALQCECALNGGSVYAENNETWLDALKAVDGLEFELKSFIKVATTFDEPTPMDRPAPEGWQYV